MKTARVAVLLSVVCCVVRVSAGERRDSQEAELAVTASGGRPQGVFKLHFDRPARVFTSDKMDLTPTVGYWLDIVFTSYTGETYHLGHREVQMWPYAEGVRDIRRGETISTEFSVLPKGAFFLKAKSGRRLDVLPVGRYRVVARFHVPQEHMTRRLRLTPISVESSPVILEVSES